MPGIFDSIAKAVADAGNGHTTSGLDRAMQTQADKLHPASSGGGVQQKESKAPATSSLKHRGDGSLILPMDGDYKP